MHASYLLAFAAVAFGCTNPDTNSCASFIKSQTATASAFCATFTRTAYTATTGLPSWASNCKNKPNEISKECSCHWQGAAPTTLTTSTTVPPVTTTSSGTVPTTSSGGGGGSCGSAAVNQLVGFGSGVTGGGSGSGTTVTSCSALRTAVAAGGVIRISGMLSGCGIIDLLSNTSVFGVGSNSGLSNGGGFRIRQKSNVILRNLRFYVATSGGDLVALDEATRVWIDHCDFASTGLVGGKDDYDGLLDITHASDYVTVSWCKFHDHWKGSLVGHSDSNSGEDTGKFRLTYHHNHWSNVNSRLPSLRFGTGHIYNSCFENNPTSGINSRMGAQVLVQNSHFVNTKLAITTNLDSDIQGYATSSGNLFEGSTTDITRTSSFTPSYSFTLDPVSCICAHVKSNAGTGVISP